MKAILLLVIMSFPFLSNSQSKIYNPNEITIQKWQHACVAISGIRTNDRGDEQTAPIISEITQKYLKHEINERQYDELISQYKPKTQQWGVAVFLKYNKLHYLVTARHVIEDMTSYSGVYKKMLIVNRIGRTNVLSYSENLNSANIVKSDWDEIYLHVYSPPAKKMFVWSDRESDVGIICLDYLESGEGSAVIETLYKRGHQPISIADIDVDFQVKEGAPIMAIGFPNESTSGLAVTEKSFDFVPNTTSIPLVTTGIVTDRNETQNYFFGGIWVYHGMSGGPIIANDKLIGIVSRGDTNIINANNVENQYMILRPRFSKSSLIIALIKGFENTPK